MSHQLHQKFCIGANIIADLGLKKGEKKGLAYFHFIHYSSLNFYYVSLSINYVKIYTDMIKKSNK